MRPTGTNQIPAKPGVPDEHLASPDSSSVESIRKPLVQSRATESTLLHPKTAHDNAGHLCNISLDTPQLLHPSTTQPVLLSPQASSAPVNQETVKLANHVSLQIISSDFTQSNKNVVVFLHGGPGLEYNESYEPMTSWFISHGYTFIAPEIAGSGKDGLENTSNSYTLNYVRDLKAVIQGGLKYEVQHPVL